MINIPNSEQSDLSECALYLNLIITVIPEETLQHFVNIEHELEVVVIMTGRAGSHQVTRVIAAAAVTAPSPVFPESADVTFLRDNCQWQSEANIVLC